jgi:hypothetical protein
MVCAVEGMLGALEARAHEIFALGECGMVKSTA